MAEHEALTVFQAACDELEQDLRRDPSCAFAYEMRARCLLELGRTREAIEDAEAATAASPHRANAWLTLAHAFLSCGHIFDAARALRRAVSATSGDPSARRIASEELVRVSRLVDEYEKDLGLQVGICGLNVAPLDPHSSQGDPDCSLLLARAIVDANSAVPQQQPAAGSVASSLPRGRRSGHWSRRVSAELPRDAHTPSRHARSARSSESEVPERELLLSVCEDPRIQGSTLEKLGSGTVAVTSRRGQPAKETSTALSNSREEDGPVRVVIQSTRNFINPWSQSGHEPMSDLSDHSRRESGAPAQHPRALPEEPEALQSVPEDVALLLRAPMGDGLGELAESVPENRARARGARCAPPPQASAAGRPQGPSGASNGPIRQIVGFETAAGMGTGDAPPNTVSGERALAAGGAVDVEDPIWRQSRDLVKLGLPVAMRGTPEPSLMSPRSSGGMAEAPVVGTAEDEEGRDGGQARRHNDHATDATHSASQHQAAAARTRRLKTTTEATGRDPPGHPWVQHAQRAPHRSSVERAESPPGIAVVGIVGVGRGRRDKKERGMAVGSVGSQDLPLPDALFSADATSPGRCLLLGDGEKLLSLRNSADTPFAPLRRSSNGSDIPQGGILSPAPSPRVGTPNQTTGSIAAVRRPQTLQVDHTLSDLYKPRQSEAEIQKEINLRLSALVTAHEDGSEAERGSDSPNKQTTHSNSANTEPLWQSSKGTSSRSSHPCPWEASAHSLSQPALARDPAGGRTCVSGPASNDEVRASGGPAQAGGGRTGSTMGARGPGGGIASEGTAAPRFNPRSYNPCGALQPYSLQGHAPPPHSPAPATKPQAGGLPGWDQLSMAPASHLPTGGAGTTASSDDAIIPIKAPGENSKVVGEASAGGRCERVGEPCGCGRACESPLPTAISLAPSLDLAPTASSPEGPLLPGGDRDVAETHPRGAGDAPVVDLQPRAGTPSPHWAADRSVSAGSGSFPLSKSARCSVAQMEEEEKDTMVSLKPYLTCVGLRVLEIGAGSGLVGLACAALGAHVVVADRDPISSGVLQRNVEQNEKLVAKARGEIGVVTFDWREPDNSLSGLDFHLILGSDLVSDAADIPRFVNVLDVLLADLPDADFVMAHKHRSLSIDAPLEAALSSAGYSIRLLGSHIIYADETDARRASDLGGGDVTRGAPGARGERMVTGRGLGGVDLDELRRSGAGAGVPGEVVSLLHLRRRIRGIQAAVGTADRYLAHCSDWSFY